MGFSYFSGKSWAMISREERYYCALLWAHLREDAANFIKWLNCRQAQITLPTQAVWEVGYEVCLYRDYLHAFHRPNFNNYSLKRTFDFVFFAEEAIILVEAKVQQGYDSTQLEHLRQDIDNIRRMLEINLPVYTLGIASSRYTPADQTKRYFDLGIISWRDLSALYSDAIFLERADMLYSEPR